MNYEEVDAKRTPYSGTLYVGQPKDFQDNQYATAALKYRPKQIDAISTIKSVGNEADRIITELKSAIASGANPSQFISGSVNPGNLIDFKHEVAKSLKSKTGKDLDENIEELRRQYIFHNVQTAVKNNEYVRKMSDNAIMRAADQGTDLSDRWKRIANAYQQGANTVSMGMTLVTGDKKLAQAHYDNQVNFQKYKTNDFLDWSATLAAQSLPYLTATTAVGAAGALTGSAAFGASGFVAGSIIGQMAPAFVVEGSSMYMDALNSGATKEQATAIGIGGGIISAMIESLPIPGAGKAIKAAKATAKVKAISKFNRLMNATRKASMYAGGDFTKGAMREATEEALQELTSVLMPAIVSGAVPRDEMGNIDYDAIMDNITDAWVGGLVLGGAAEASVSMASKFSPLDFTARGIMEKTLPHVKEVAEIEREGKKGKIISMPGGRHILLVEDESIEQNQEGMLNVGQYKPDGFTITHEETEYVIDGTIAYNPKHDKPSDVIRHESVHWYLTEMQKAEPELFGNLYRNIMKGEAPTSDGVDSKTVEAHHVLTEKVQKRAEQSLFKTIINDVKSGADILFRGDEATNASKLNVEARRAEKEIGSRLSFKNKLTAENVVSKGKQFNEVMNMAVRDSDIPRRTQLPAISDIEGVSESTLSTLKNYKETTGKKLTFDLLSSKDELVKAGIDKDQAELVSLSYKKVGLQNWKTGLSRYFEKNEEELVNNIGRRRIAASSKSKAISEMSLNKNKDEDILRQVKTGLNPFIMKDQFEYVNTKQHIANIIDDVHTGSKKVVISSGLVNDFLARVQEGESVFKFGDIDTEIDMSYFVERYVEGYTPNDVNDKNAKYISNMALDNTSNGALNIKNKTQAAALIARVLARHAGMDLKPSYPHLVVQTVRTLAEEHLLRGQVQYRIEQLFVRRLYRMWVSDKDRKSRLFFYRNNIENLSSITKEKIRKDSNPAIKTKDRESFSVSDLKEINPNLAKSERPAEPVNTKNYYDSVEEIFESLKAREDKDYAKEKDFIRDESDNVFFRVLSEKEADGKEQAEVIYTGNVAENTVYSSAKEHEMIYDFCNTLSEMLAVALKTKNTSALERFLSVNADFIEQIGIALEYVPASLNSKDNDIAISLSVKETINLQEANLTAKERIEKEKELDKLTGSGVGNIFNVRSLLRKYSSDLEKLSAAVTEILSEARIGLGGMSSRLLDRELMWKDSRDTKVKYTNEEVNKLKEESVSNEKLISDIIKNPSLVVKALNDKKYTAVKIAMGYLSAYNIKSPLNPSGEVSIDDHIGGIDYPLRKRVVTQEGDTAIFAGWTNYVYALATILNDLHGIPFSKTKPDIHYWVNETTGKSYLEQDADLLYKDYDGIMEIMHNVGKGMQLDTKPVKDKGAFEIAYMIYMEAMRDFDMNEEVFTNVQGFAYNYVSEAIQSATEKYVNKYNSEIAGTYSNQINATESFHENYSEIENKVIEDFLKYEDSLSEMLRRERAEALRSGDENKLREIERKEADLYSISQKSPIEIAQFLREVTDYKVSDNALIYAADKRRFAEQTKELYKKAAEQVLAKEELSALAEGDSNEAAGIREALTSIVQEAQKTSHVDVLDKIEKAADMFMSVPANQADLAAETWKTMRGLKDVLTTSSIVEASKIREAILSLTTGTTIPDTIISKFTSTMYGIRGVSKAKLFSPEYKNLSFAAILWIDRMEYKELFDEFAAAIIKVLTSTKELTPDHADFIRFKNAYDTMMGWKEGSREFEVMNKLYTETLKPSNDAYAELYKKGRMGKSVIKYHENYVPHIYETLNDGAVEAFNRDGKSGRFLERRYRAGLAEAYYGGKKLVSEDLAELWYMGTNQARNAFIDKIMFDVMIKQSLAVLKTKEIIDKKTKKKSIVTNAMPKGYREVNIPGLGSVYLVESLAESFEIAYEPNPLRKHKWFNELMNWNKFFKMSRLTANLFHQDSLLGSLLYGGPEKIMSIGKLKSLMSAGRESINGFDFETRVFVARTVAELSKSKHLPNIELESKNDAQILVNSVFGGTTLFAQQDLTDNPMDNMSIPESGQKALGFIKNKFAKKLAVKPIINMSNQMSRYQMFLFHRFGNDCKTAVVLAEVKLLMKKHQEELLSGKMEMKDIYRAASKAVNNDFGGVNTKFQGAWANAFSKFLNTKTGQDFCRLIFLGHDWTRSNLSMIKDAARFGGTAENQLIGEINRAMLWRAAVRGTFVMLVCNLLMCAIDDEDPIERFEKAYEYGNFHWMNIDISPLFHAFGASQDKDYYVNPYFQYADALHILNKPGSSMYWKGSPTAQAVIDAYKVDSLSHVPSALMSTASNNIPLSFQNIMSVLKGQSEALEGMTRLVGIKAYSEEIR